MTAMTDECPIFENEDWLVTESGLEHKQTGYFIERDSLGQRREDGLWAWPLHMAEKSWCAMKSFTEAFSRAASALRRRDWRGACANAEGRALRNLAVAAGRQARLSHRSAGPGRLASEEGNPHLHRTALRAETLEWSRFSGLGRCVAHPLENRRAPVFDNPA